MRAKPLVNSPTSPLSTSGYRRPTPTKGWSLPGAAERRHPATAVVLLSQYVEPRYAQRLLSDQPGGLGYLLKERVSDIAVLVDALQRVGG